MSFRRFSMGLTLGLLVIVTACGGDSSSTTTVPPTTPGTPTPSGGGGTTSLQEFILQTDSRLRSVNISLTSTNPSFSNVAVRSNDPGTASATGIVGSVEFDQDSNAIALILSRSLLSIEAFGPNDAQLLASVDLSADGAGLTLVSTETNRVRVGSRFITQGTDGSTAPLVEFVVTEILQNAAGDVSLAGDLTLRGPTVNGVLDTTAGTSTQPSTAILNSGSLQADFSVLTAGDPDTPTPTPTPLPVAPSGAVEVTASENSATLAISAAVPGLVETIAVSINNRTQGGDAIVIDVSDDPVLSQLTGQAAIGDPTSDPVQTVSANIGLDTTIFENEDVLILNLAVTDQAGQTRTFQSNSFVAVINEDDVPPPEPIAVQAIDQITLEAGSFILAQTQSTAVVGYGPLDSPGAAGLTVISPEFGGEPIINRRDTSDDDIANEVSSARRPSIILCGGAPNLPFFPNLDQVDQGFAINADGDFLDAIVGTQELDEDGNTVITNIREIDGTPTNSVEAQLQPGEVVLQRERASTQDSLPPLTGLASSFDDRRNAVPPLFVRNQRLGEFVFINSEGAVLNPDSVVNNPVTLSGQKLTITSNSNNFLTASVTGANFDEVYLLNYEEDQVLEQIIGSCDISPDGATLTFETITELVDDVLENHVGLFTLRGTDGGVDEPDSSQGGLISGVQFSSDIPLLDGLVAADDPRFSGTLNLNDAGGNQIRTDITLVFDQIEGETTVAADRGEPINTNNGLNVASGIPPFTTANSNREPFNLPGRSTCSGDAGTVCGRFEFVQPFDPTEVSDILVITGTFTGLISEETLNP